MNTLVRWLKFNLVGAVGMAVQLGSLAILNWLWPGHYLAATAAALELTLVHNFVWHLHFTWRDRREQSAMAGQFIRFHLSNGLVSLVGNLALMPFLVEGARIPVVAANLIAILGCSMVNFCLGNSWAFPPSGESKGVMKAAIRTSMLLGCLAFCRIAWAQAPQPADRQSTTSSSPETTPPKGSAPQTSTNTLPEAPAPQPATPPEWRPKSGDSYPYHVGAFCGGGASTSAVATKPTFGCGAGMTVFAMPDFPVFLEAGVMSPQANRSDVSGYLSLDGNLPLARP